MTTISYSQIDKLLEFSSNTVKTVFNNKLDACINIAKINNEFEKFMHPIIPVLELMQNDKSNIDNVASAAILTDLLIYIRTISLVDDVISDEEKEVIFKVLENSSYRFSWIPKYKQYSPLISVDHAFSFLTEWNNDCDFWGGDVNNGNALSTPFMKLSILASLCQKDLSSLENYIKVIRAVIRVIAKSDGITDEEEHTKNAIRAKLFKFHALTKDIIVDLSNEDNSKPECEDIDNKVNQIMPDISKTDDEILNSEEVLKSAISELNSLIGVGNIKESINSLLNFLEVRKQRISAKLPIPTQSLHFVFTGNPGTGKTTVARIISKILFGCGYLKTSNFIEADRSTLVAKYVGQTAIKTDEAIEKAINGILFIDEAYTLVNDTESDFGLEAVDTLLKRMEDLRDKIVIIVAGYPDRMNKFLASNPGLESRFTRFIEFEDYHVNELCRIFEMMCHSNAYSLTQECRANLCLFFNKAFRERNSNFGNARFVRNVFEKTINNHADRIMSHKSEINRSVLITIEKEDIPYNLVHIDGPSDMTNSKWNVTCPKCSNNRLVNFNFIGSSIRCKCGCSFICPWWSLDSASINDKSGYTFFKEKEYSLGYF